MITFFLHLCYFIFIQFCLRCGLVHTANAAIFYTYLGKEEVTDGLGKKLPIHNRLESFGISYKWLQTTERLGERLRVIVIEKCQTMYIYLCICFCLLLVVVWHTYSIETEPNAHDTRYSICFVLLFDVLQYKNHAVKWRVFHGEIQPRKNVEFIKETKISQNGSCFSHIKT